MTSSTSDSSSLGSPPFDVSALRIEYGDAEHSEASLAPNWPAQLRRWLTDAVAAGVTEPNAMVLGTADPAGRPSARTVLLKGYDDQGLVFFTNYESRKGRELAGNPWASLVFPWYPLRRQVVVAGYVRRVTRAETDAYFATRPRDSALGAWASEQSSVVPDRASLDESWQRAQRRFPAGEPVPAPPFWGGFRLAPETVEFWQGRSGRMHDRLRYRRVTELGTGEHEQRDSGEWIVERLAP